MQPVVLVGEVARFKQNAIVRFLLDRGRFDMNDLGAMTFSPEDRSQFAQLIGYSVCGYADLDYAEKRIVRRADVDASQLVDASSAP